MNETAACPIFELDREIPDRLYVLSEPATGRYGCYCFQGVHGLAVFEHEDAAWAFAEWLPVQQVTCLKVGFDEARSIAKSRPMPVVSVMLLDDVDDPVIHYVR
jgi:hypothetical protein